MKVTNVETIHVSRFMYVKVMTDEGITGIGELHPASGTGGTPYLPMAGVQYCAEYLVGQDPRPIERHWQHLFRRCLFRGGADVMAALHNFAIQEYPGDEYASPKRDLVEEPLTREGGYLLLPTAPGLGITLNEEAFKHYPPQPYSRPPLIAPDGSLREY